MVANQAVNLKELRENLSEYEERVEKGESFVVMRHSKPLFRISPVEEEGWETVVDFTKFRKGGISAKELLSMLKSV